MLIDVVSDVIRLVSSSFTDGYRYTYFNDEGCIRFCSTNVWVEQDVSIYLLSGWLITHYSIGLVS